MGLIDFIDSEERLKACKKELKAINKKVLAFMKRNGYRKGSYHKLQQSQVWIEGKKTLLEYYRLKSIDLVCFYCKETITDNPTLHHKTYNWKKLFDPKKIAFLHHKCHGQLHHEKRGFKKKTWKKILKAMIQYS